MLHFIYVTKKQLNNHLAEHIERLQHFKSSSQDSINKLNEEFRNSCLNFI